MGTLLNPFHTPSSPLMRHVAPYSAIHLKSNSPTSVWCIISIG